MLDIGWQELFVIGVIVLIVVGPKDLPQVLRSAARILQKVRGLAREFQNGVSEMVREAELDEIKRTAERAARFDIGDEVKKTVDPTDSLTEDFDPAQFARELKETVESGPPTGPMTRKAPASAKPADAAKNTASPKAGTSKSKARRKATRSSEGAEG